MEPSETSADIDQHNAEIHENLRHWQRKPALRAEYQRFYGMIAESLKGVPAGPVLECGSGIGNLKSVLPQAITSDLFPNPWLDRQENVYALSFADQSLSAVVLFDVFHHLQYPGTALAEIHRVLQPGGRVAIFEPAMGLLGRIALGLFHHEPLGLAEPITWMSPAGFEPGSSSYYAAQGNAWRIFVRRRPLHEPDGFAIRQIITLAALPWLLTGGFRGPDLAVPGLQRVIATMDRALQFVPRFFASRMLVVLEKPGPSNTAPCREV